MALAKEQRVWALQNLPKMNRINIRWLLPIIIMYISCSNQNHFNTCFFRLVSPSNFTLEAHYTPTPETDIPSLHHIQNDTTTIINFSDTSYNHVTDIQWIIIIDTFTYQNIWNLVGSYDGYPLGEPEHFDTEYPFNRYIFNEYHNTICSCSPISSNRANEK